MHIFSIKIKFQSSKKFRCICRGYILKHILIWILLYFQCNQCAWKFFEQLHNGRILYKYVIHSEYPYTIDSCRIWHAGSHQLFTWNPFYNSFTILWESTCISPLSGCYRCWKFERCMHIRNCTHKAEGNVLCFGNIY